MRPPKKFPFYRIAFKVAGKRRMLTFGTYGEAKKAAEDKVKELHKGQPSSALTAKQAQDALAVYDMLAAFWQETGFHRRADRQLPIRRQATAERLLAAGGRPRVSPEHCRRPAEAAGVCRLGVLRRA